VSVHESIPAGCEPACHGCRHRHLTLEASLAQKRRYLERALAPWHDRLQDVRSGGEASRYGYRDRVTLNAGWDPANGWRFGLMRRDELIAIPDCPVHTPRVNALLRLLRGRLPPFANLPLAYVHVAGAQATLIVKAKTVDLALFDDLLGGLGPIGLEGLWLHCHPSAGRRLFARSGWQRLWGEAESRGHGGPVHGPTSFQQLLPDLHAQALREVAAHLAPRAGDAVLDLYCGLGVSLRLWTAAGAATLGVELAGDAVDNARRNAPDALVLRGTCVQRLPQVREWWHRQPAARLAYVNPPRSGLESELQAALARELRPSRIAYLSCSAGTLARDLTVFEAEGYAVDRLVPYDFFPGTHHVECLALLSRVAPPAAG
jgi:23S rRNA (uracil1939-C5)-methyltransferase